MALECSNISAFALGFHCFSAHIRFSEQRDPLLGLKFLRPVGKEQFTAFIAASAVIGLPTSIPVASMTAGQYHTCGLLTTGALWCWGSNSNGQLGLGYANITGCLCVVSPSAVTLSSFAVSVSAGDFHTCVILLSGELQCWGSIERTLLG